ncbi:MAG: hypothetical protein R3F11_00735 [Verrucomicrobiales bacterium]
MGHRSIGIPPIIPIRKVAAHFLGAGFGGGKVASASCRSSNPNGEATDQFFGARASQSRVSRET